MTTIPSTDEQIFLVTLQECLQADNEKRTAAEVFNLKNFISFLPKLIFISLGYLSRYTGWTKNNFINVNITKYHIRYTGKRERKILFLI